jgi:hypothetical protein
VVACTAYSSRGLGEASASRLEGGQFSSGLGERLFKRDDPGLVFGLGSIAASSLDACALASTISPPQETAERAQHRYGRTEYGEDRLNGVHRGYSILMPTAISL